MKAKAIFDTFKYIGLITDIKGKNGLYFVTVKEYKSKQEIVYIVEK